MEQRGGFCQGCRVGCSSPRPCPCTANPPVPPSPCSWWDRSGQPVSWAWGVPRHPCSSCSGSMQRAGGVGAFHSRGDALQSGTLAGGHSARHLAHAVATSSPGHLPTEIAFLESCPCCWPASPAAPTAPRHQRHHRPEAEQGENPAVPGHLPAPRQRCRAQNKPCRRDQLRSGWRAGMNVERHTGVLLLPCHIAWLCPTAAAGCWRVPPAPAVRAGGA